MSKRPKLIYKLKTFIQNSKSKSLGFRIQDFKQKSEMQKSDSVLDFEWQECTLTLMVSVNSGQRKCIL